MSSHTAWRQTANRFGLRTSLAAILAGLLMTGCEQAKPAAFGPPKPGTVSVRTVDSQGDAAGLMTSFSAPRPTVVLDPVVVGDTATDDRHCIVDVNMQGGFAMVTVSGAVYDGLADIVGDHKADITTVALEFMDPASESMSRSVPIPVKRVEGGKPTALRPFPFKGRFKGTPTKVPLWAGDHMVAVTANNADNRQGAHSFFIRVPLTSPRLTRRDGGIVVAPKLLPGVTAALNPPTGMELWNPIRVLIDDPEVNETNITAAKATVQGHEFALRFVDGQLQLDRPIAGIGNAMPVGMPNLFNVMTVGRVSIEYRGVKEEVSFAWTGGP